VHSVAYVVVCWKHILLPCKTTAELTWNTNKHELRNKSDRYTQWHVCELLTSFVCANVLWHYKLCILHRNTKQKQSISYGWVHWFFFITEPIKSSTTSICRFPFVASLFYQLVLMLSNIPTYKSNTESICSFGYFPSSMLKKQQQRSSVVQITKWFRMDILKFMGKFYWCLSVCLYWLVRSPCQSCRSLRRQERCPGCTTRRWIYFVRRNHLERCTALSSGTECERYWEARTKMMKNWLLPFSITISVTTHY